MQRPRTGLESGPEGDAVVTESLYTFDCRREDGSPICLEAKELGSDVRAMAWAKRLLDEHVTCASVEVFDGDRLVGAAARATAAADVADDLDEAVASLL